MSASRLWRLMAMVLLAALSAWALPARAAAVSAAETKQVRAVIQAQLDAFAADDAKRAFSYATPALRETFGTPQRFIEMVRGGYPVVYRPASVSFLQPERAGADVIQRVQMTDAKGASWTAVYLMQRQRDRSWRIGGCEVAASKGQFT